MLTMEMCKHKVYSNRKERGKRQEKFRQTNVVQKKKKKEETKHDTRACATGKGPVHLRKGTTGIIQLTFLRAVADRQQYTDVRLKLNV